MTQPNSRALAWIPVGLAGVCLLLGGVLFAVGWHQRAKANAASAWPSTDAVITTSRVVERQVQDRRSRAWYTVHDADIAYRYTVADRVYQGTKLDPTGFTTSGDVSAVARYPLGAHVRAYYDPANPADAALTHAASAAQTLFLVIGALVGLVALPFLYLAMRLARRAS